MLNEIIKERIQRAGELALTAPTFAKTVFVTNSTLALASCAGKYMTEAERLEAAETLKDQVTLVLEREEEEGTFSAFDDVNGVLCLAADVISGLLGKDIGKDSE